MYLDDLSDDGDDQQSVTPIRKPSTAVSPVEQVEPPRRKSIVMNVNELDNIPRRKSMAVNNSQNLTENRIAEIEQKLQKKMSIANPNRKIKVVHHLEDDDEDTASTITENSGIYFV